ncbi:hypothetical protein CCS41_01045 [Candidatus Fukatsuia symbiotica]|uniref:Uncharacterized protein n=1 Tax=Candidatus Fukatsuia symbiotica TaxID=1878942 RepID=A0A2U8I2R8_9GAMM|nr:hypothetical protein CCS41_01045 [Candidatus Fukatsuia symbiotica]
MSLPALPTNVSLPVSPQRTSCPVPPTNRSLPAPPNSALLPDQARSISLPSSPCRVLLPPLLSIIVSWPGPACRLIPVVAVVLCNIRLLSPLLIWRCISNT